MLVSVAAGANVPPQVLVAPGGLATDIPAGNVSVKLTPFSVPLLLLVMPIVNVLVAPELIVVGLKLLVADGAAAVGSNCADTDSGSSAIQARASMARGVRLICKIGCDEFMNFS